MVKEIICCIIIPSCVFNKNSVDYVVYNFTVSVSEAIIETIPFVKPKNSFFPHWFSKSLTYIKKKNQFFKKYKKSKSVFITVSFLITIN
jgi:hypothetical protein